MHCTRSIDNQTLSKYILLFNDDRNTTMSSNPLSLYISVFGYAKIELRLKMDVCGPELVSTDFYKIAAEDVTSPSATCQNDVVGGKQEPSAPTSHLLCQSGLVGLRQG